jgi:hypothetical protein
VDVDRAARGDVDDGARQDLAEGDDDLEVGPQLAQRRLGFRTFGSCSTRTPRLSATGLTGGGASAWPRPLARSGCVTSAATSWPASSSASRLGTANAPLASNTTRTPAATPPSP